MFNQLDVIKKAAALIEEKKYIKAKDILNNFIKNNKTLRIDIKFYYICKNTNLITNQKIDYERKHKLKGTTSSVFIEEVFSKPRSFIN